MTTAMNQQVVQDHMELFSHMYPALYSQAAVPEQGRLLFKLRNESCLIRFCRWFVYVCI